MAAISPESLGFIVNHVVLPPHLPQKAEDAQVSRAAERDLIGLLSTQLMSYSPQVDHRSASIQAAWAGIHMMLNRCALLISSHDLDADLILRAFRGLETTGESCDVTLRASELTGALSQPFSASSLSQSSKRGAYPAQRREVGHL